MLTAFTARPVIELKQRDKSKVESILTYGDRLLVGLSTGTLRVYRINEEEVPKHQSDPASTDERPSSPTRQQPVAELLRETEKFARRAVEQLAVIKEANLLVCLSDGYVSTHDLQHENYQPLEQLTKTKGASTFAVTSNIVKDASSGVPSIVSRLAVAVKRRVLLWSWQDTELATSAVEVTLTAAARTLTWASATTLVCGLNSGYVMLNVESQEVSNILGSGNVGGGPSGHDEGRFGALGATGMGYVGMGNWVPKPLATPLIDGELLLAKDVNTLFVDRDGKGLDRRQIQWTTAPDVIAFSYPYLLALQGPPKGTLEVRNPRTLSRLQSIPMANASRVHVPQPSVSLAHAGKGFLVASGRCIWRMTAESYESQIQQLLEKGLLDEAISLIEMLEDPLLDHKEQRLREIKMQKAEALFHARKFRASLDLFTDVSAPPERVIKLYPSTIAGDLAAARAATGNFPSPTLTAIDEKRTEQQQQPAGPISDVNHPDRPSEAARSRAESKARSDDTSARSMRREDSIDDHLAGNVSSNLEKSSSEIGLNGKDLRAAILELYSFLADTRRRLQLLLEPDGTPKPSAQIDGDERDGNMGATLQTFLDQLDSPEETTDVGELLRNTAKLVDTTLFRAYMIERPARAGSLFRIPNFCDPDVVQERLLETGRYEDLVDFLHGKRLHRQALELLKQFGQASSEDEAPAALRGPSRTVAYLQNLPPDRIDLILEFARWPLHEEPALGMEVFVADTENADNLPRQEVLSYLEQLHPTFATHYLEHIILELNDQTHDFHQRLVDLYLDRLMQSKRAGAPDQHGLEGVLNRPNLTDRLLSFLKGSSQYSTGRTYHQIPRDDPDFYEARAIVLSKMGNHKQALEIYVFKLQDPAKAEEYSNQVYLTAESTPSFGSSLDHPSSSGEGINSIYHTLLSLYLAPPSPYQPDWTAALHILSRHGSRLPASSLLDLIPASLPLQNLQSYLRGRLRAGTSAMNEGRVVRGLSSSELERLRAALLIGDGIKAGPGSRNRSVVVSEEKVCRVCHKRLGRSVISVFPDNSVVHYGCASRAQGQA